MRRILVTGASRGIGRALAVRLTDRDSILYLHGRDLAALEETADMVRNNGGAAETIVADLSQERDIVALADSTGGKPLDVLINNAGVAFVKPIGDLTIEEWRTTVDVNITAPFLLTQRLLPAMHGGSTIVNVLSIAAVNGFPSWTSYCASKFALDGFSRALREELRPRGIRVVTVIPAATDTAIWDSIEGNFSREKMLSPDEVAEAIAFAISRPDDVLVETLTIGNIAGTL
ncbi:SDR family NAD(P)-dependent oxidoreductase [bacterium]|nr:SDR family NAD(P)-dependent oxidoreductase [bacterium]MCB2202321.1 SDR family NAD(P)-dependent oxidoreductase [bacterium]